MSEVSEVFRQAFDSARPNMPGAELSWLSQAREQAMAHFELTGFPKPREEDWKYTRTSAIEKVNFSTAAAASGVDVSAELLDLGGPCLVFLDGRFVADASETLRGDGASVLDLRSALAHSPDLLAEHLNHYADPRRHAFTALNTALNGDGAVLHLPRNASIAAPVQLLFVSTGESDTMAHPRVLLIAEQGSDVTLIEHYVGRGNSKYLNNPLTEVSVGANARVNHYKVQREATSAFHVSTLQVRQQADSRFVSHSVSLGAALARHDINIELMNPGAECTLNGLYMATGRQHVDYHTLVDHRSAHCSSNEDYKGVLGGRSRGVFNGRVVVHPDAQKTDARQSNKNLLLSADAEIDTKPQLEIYADDVKCAHGATVGQLDERMVFYLRTRGLNEAQARALLTYGFACDMVNRMEIEVLRTIVADALLDELPHADELRSMLT